MKIIFCTFLMLSQTLSALALQPIAIIGVVKSFDKTTIVIQQDKNLLRIEKKYFSTKNFKSGEIAIATLNQDGFNKITQSKE